MAARRRGRWQAGWCCKVGGRYLQEQEGCCRTGVLHVCVATHSGIVMDCYIWRLDRTFLVRRAHLTTTCMEHCLLGPHTR
jgi:hypothetical protein